MVAMFCPKCKALMFPKEGVKTCPKCGYTEKGKDEKITFEREVKEEKGIIEDSQTLPTTKEECPKCGHKEAYWVIRQTRAADEPPTRIYRCTKCKYSWREY